MKSLRNAVIEVVSVFALVLFCSSVQADISLSGDLEIDTSYTTKSTEDVVTTTGSDETEYDLGGRIKVVPAARKEAGNLFFEAKAEILAKTDNTDGNGVQVDDAWGKIGTSSFDVQIGRFEAWNLYDKSNDMLILEAPNGTARYEANYARGRMDGVGQLALHVTPSDAFGFELGLVYGQETADLDITTATDDPSTPTVDESADPGAVDANVVGVRPVINTKFGPVEFAVGADLLTISKQDDDGDGDISKVGFGARVKVVLGMATLGLNYASGTEEKTNFNTFTNATVDQPDETTNSMGGYLDLALGEGVFTLAGLLTNWEQDNNAFEKEHAQYYIAYAHPLPIDGAAVKFAVSQSSASDDNPLVPDSDALGFKVRLYYSF